MFSVRSIAAASLFGCLLAAGFSPADANAQQIYRIVGPDGRVTFSDKAPLDPTQASNAKTVTLAGGQEPDLSGMPFELRQAAGKYPVMLYTSAECAPCNSGRNMLTSRGIPFSERTVNSNEDIEALKRITGAPSLPFLTIGGQQLRGYSEVEWNSFLDAAGYPRTSQLPPNWTRPAAAPLVAVQDQAPVASRPPGPATTARTNTPPATPAVNPDNPKGIQF
jgi:glutaredoxin